MPDRPARPQIVLNAIRCDQCKRVLLSTSRHDFRSCDCGTFNDGGRAYLRRGAPDGVRFTDLTLFYLPTLGQIRMARDLADLEETSHDSDPVT